MTQRAEQGLILLVEDDALVRAALATVLRAEGYTLIETADAVEAIDALAAHQDAEDISMILLDIVLTRGTGLDVLSYRTVSGTYIPVLAMSMDTARLTAAAQAGADAVLFKPFDVDQLVAIAASLSDCHRRLRARLAAEASPR